MHLERKVVCFHGHEQRCAVPPAHSGAAHAHHIVMSLMNSWQTYRVSRARLGWINFERNTSASLAASNTSAPLMYTVNKETVLGNRVGTTYITPLSSQLNK